MHGTGHGGSGGAGSPGVPPGRRPAASEPSPAGGSRPAPPKLPGSPGTNLSEPANSIGPRLAARGPRLDDAALAQAKAEMRARILARRRAMPDEQRGAAGRQLRDAVLGLPELQMAGTVAAYVSVGTEPATHGLIFALWKRGTYVLLPVLRPDADLDWVTYEGPDSLVAGPRGLLEPAGDRRGVTAICSADLVVVPALAVDRAGRRLGRGGGSYDRILARVGPAIQTVALLYGGEVADEVPAGPHDQPVRTVAVAGEGISRLR